MKERKWVLLQKISQHIPFSNKYIIAKHFQILFTDTCFQLAIYYVKHCPSMSIYRKELRCGAVLECLLPGNIPFVK